MNRIKMLMVAGLGLVLAALLVSNVPNVSAQTPAAVVTNTDVPQSNAAWSNATVIPSFPDVASQERELDLKIAAKKKAGDYCDCNLTEGPFPCAHSSTCRPVESETGLYNGLKSSQ